MGQESSQMAAAQQSQPIHSTMDMTGPEGANDRPAKKQKLETNGQTRKLSKARPQHRRGVAIQPRKDVPATLTFDTAAAMAHDAASGPDTGANVGEMPMAKHFQRIIVPPRSRTTGIVSQDTGTEVGQNLDRASNERKGKDVNAPRNNTSPLAQLLEINVNTINVVEQDDDTADQEHIKDSAQLKKKRKQRKKERRRQSRDAQRSEAPQLPDPRSTTDCEKIRKQKRKEQKRKRKEEAERMRQEQVQGLANADEDENIEDFEHSQQQAVRPDITTYPRITSQATSKEYDKLLEQTRMVPGARIDRWLDGHEPEFVSSEQEVERAQSASQWDAHGSEEYPDSPVRRRNSDPPNAIEKSPVIHKLATFDVAGSRPVDIRENDGINRRRGTKRGKWTAWEKTTADAIWEDFIARNDIDDYTLRLATIKWPTVGQIKLEMYEAFPERTIESIRKMVQRRFTPYTQGPWTEEEEDILIEEYNRAPGEWTLISGAVMRPPQAVRDRWQHITQHGASRLTGPWSRIEEFNLLQVVGCVLRELRSGSDNASKSDLARDHEHSISWTRISKDLGATRSAKRCIEKWNQLKERYYGHNFDKVRVQDLTVTDFMDHGITPFAPAHSSDVQTPKSRKNQREMEALFETLEEGDIYDAVADTYWALFKRLGDTFNSETTIWSMVAKHCGEGPPFYGRSRLRRRCYYGALEQWGEHPEVKKAIGIGPKAEKMMELILGWREEVELKRVLQPPKNFNAKGEISKKKKKKVKKVKKSAEKVDSESMDDDEGDGEVEQNDAQGGAGPPTPVSDEIEEELPPSRRCPNKKRNGGVDSGEAGDALDQPMRERKKKRKTMVTLTGSPALVEAGEDDSIDDNVPAQPGHRRKRVPSRHLTKTALQIK